MNSGIGDVGIGLSLKKCGRLDRCGRNAAMSKMKYFISLDSRYVERSSTTWLMITDMSMKLTCCKCDPLTYSGCPCGRL